MCPVKPPCVGVIIFTYGDRVSYHTTRPKCNIELDDFTSTFAKIPEGRNEPDNDTTVTQSYIN